MSTAKFCLHCGGALAPHVEEGRTRMRCEACGSENREGRRYCAQCGAELTLACPACGAAPRISLPNL